MKDFISALLFAASFAGASASVDPASLDPRDVLAALSAVVRDPAANGDILVGDFTDALKCTADLSSGAVTDEAGCAAATDATGASCVWCDASGVLGQGLCVGSDVKSMAGQFWGSLCAASASESSWLSAPQAEDGVEVSLSVGDFTDALKCTADLTTGDITDEAGCAAAMDASGAACVWCDASAVIGQGLCVGGDVKSMAGGFWGSLCAASKSAALSASHPEHEEEDEDEVSLSVGDFTDALKCTADLSTGDITDETECATATDASGAACIWCDASAVIGQGLCVGGDVKSMAGQFWDALCADDSSVTPPAVPVTPSPTPLPTPNPTMPAPVPVPDDNDDDNGVPDQLKCTIDASSNLITDEATCVSKVDASSTTGEHCFWCVVPIVGGSCISHAMKSSVSFLCSGEEDIKKANLRGVKVGAWEALDPSCLGDGLAGGTKESCGTRVDSNGEKCIWCDAGDDVFGLCATPSQKGYIGSYMDCAEVDPVAAVAVE